MSVLDIHSYDDGEQLEELDFVGITPRCDGPSYEQLLEEEAEIAKGLPERMERSAFEDGVDVGRGVVAQQLLKRAPDGFSSQADAARWARWAVHVLNRIIADPKI